MILERKTGMQKRIHLGCFIEHFYFSITKRMLLNPFE